MIRLRNGGNRRD